MKTATCTKIRTSAQKIVARTKRKGACLEQGPVTASCRYNEVIRTNGLPFSYILSSGAAVTQLPLVLTGSAGRAGSLGRPHGSRAQKKQEKAKQGKARELTEFAKRDKGAGEKDKVPCLSASRQRRARAAKRTSTQGVMKMPADVAHRINELIDRDQWDEARCLILAALEDKPGDHWLLDRLSLTYYEQRRYAEAFEVIKEAYRLMPNCPGVLWDYAGTLDMLGRKKEAIRIYKRLIARGVQKIANGECGEGVDWAKGLIADCKYRLALCYRDLSDNVSALRYFYGYFSDLSQGIDSIYKDEVDAADAPIKLLFISSAKSPSSVRTVTASAYDMGGLTPVTPGSKITTTSCRKLEAAAVPLSLQG
jgi:hypothetical protein